jgi:hypothetical protein
MKRKDSGLMDILRYFFLLTVIFLGVVAIVGCSGGGGGGGELQTYSASGTYVYDINTGVLSFTFTSSDFPDCGPYEGTEIVNVDSTSETTMIWDYGDMTWTRSSGTSGDITGSWNYTDESGNSYDAIINDNGTMSVTGEIVECGDADAGRWNQLRQDRLEIGRGMLEVQNVDWTTLLGYYAGDIEYHDSIVDVYGLDILTQFLGRLYGSSPDLVTTIEDETLDGGVYSATWTMVGTFNGVKYTAKGMSIIKFRGWSREVYYWRDYYSEGDIMSNIPGFDEVILGFRTYYRCAVDLTFDCPLELVDGIGSPEIEPLVDSPASDNYSRSISSLNLRWKRLEIGRALVEINAANWQSLLPYYTDDYEYHDPIIDIYGYDTLVPFFARLFASSPDLVTTVEDEMLIGGVYTATWTMVGEFNGVPYSAKGMSILKFRPRSTQTYYSRDYYSESDIMATIPELSEVVEGFRVFYKCVVDPAFECPLPPPTP